MGKRHVLVTGGAGFIGSHLVAGLLADGHRVRVLDALLDQVHEGKEPAHLDSRAEFVRGDVADAVAVDRALAGIDAVYHEAAEVGVAQSMYAIDRYVRGNTGATAVLLERIVLSGRVRKLVVASSNTLYGEGSVECPRCGVVHPSLRPEAQLALRRWDLDCPRCGTTARPVPTSEDKLPAPSTPYALTKYDQEQLCLMVGRAYGIPTVALRYFNVYGPGQALSNPYTGVCAIFSARLLNGQPPLVFEDGRQTRDFVHVSDVVAANLRALATDQADYQACNVATGRGTSVLEVARALAAGLGIAIEPEVVGKYRAGDIRHCVADISRARRLLGYEPRIEFRVGLPGVIDWVRSQAPQDRAAQATAELEERRLIR